MVGVGGVMGVGRFVGGRFCWDVMGWGKFWV